MMTYEEICDEQKQLLFKKSIDDKENETTVSVMSLRKIAQNMLNVNYFPIDFSKPNLEPIEQY